MSAEEESPGSSRDVRRRAESQNSVGDSIGFVTTHSSDYTLYVSRPRPPDHRDPSPPDHRGASPVGTPVGSRLLVALKSRTVEPGTLRSCRESGAVDRKEEFH